LAFIADKKLSGKRWEKPGKAAKWREEVGKFRHWGCPDMLDKDFL